MRKRKQPNPKFHVGDRVHCQTIDLWGRRLTVKEVRWNGYTNGWYEYVLEDEKGMEIWRRSAVNSHLIPEFLLAPAEGILEKYIRLSKPFLGCLLLKVRVITLDTKENTIEDKTFPEFHRDDFDIYITDCYEKLEKGEIYGIKIIRLNGIPTMFRPKSETKVCVPT